MTSMAQLNALDPRSLADLQRLARSEGRSNDALRAAAQQFEALFMQMMLKSMRDASPGNSLLDSEQTRMYQGLLDQQLALNLSQGRGTGLAQTLFRQLGGKDEGALPAVVAGESSASGGFDLAALRRQPASSAAMARATLAAALGQAVPAAAELQDRLPASGLPLIDSTITQLRWRESIQDVRAAGAVVPPHVHEFVTEMWPHALQASERTGIPPAFMIAQAALETGWGEKQLRHDDGRSSHNLFNIKAGSHWQGATVERTVTEFAGSRPYAEAARFRAYGSYAESFRDYAELMMNSPRYAAVRGQTDAAGFARSLQQAGYATDPHYADKLTRILGSASLRQALGSLG